MARRTKKEVSELRAFTDKIKKQLEEFYAKNFDSITRLSDKERYKRNDMVAIEAMKDGKKITIQEKFVHVKELSQYLYFEWKSTNRNGVQVAGMGQKSRANVIIYILWDDVNDEIAKIYAYRVKPLQLFAFEEWKKRLLGRSNDIKLFNRVDSFGKNYKAWSLEFDPKTISEELRYPIVD